MHAINSSRYVTTDMEAADVIYVYDHCYYVLWLAQVRQTPAVQTLVCAQHMVHTSRPCKGD